MICYKDNILWMNPGSPTYPGKKHKFGSLGTVGIIEIIGNDIFPIIVNLKNYKID
jgi:hypothetical protein